MSKNLFIVISLVLAGPSVQALECSLEIRTNGQIVGDRAINNDLGGVTTIDVLDAKECFTKARTLANLPQISYTDIFCMRKDVCGSATVYSYVQWELNDSYVLDTSGKVDQYTRDSTSHYTGDLRAGPSINP